MLVCHLLLGQLAFQIKLNLWLSTSSLGFISLSCGEHSEPGLSNINCDSTYLWTTNWHLPVNYKLALAKNIASDWTTRHLLTASVETGPCATAAVALQHSLRESGWNEAFCAPGNRVQQVFRLVLQKTLESPLDCKEIQPVHSKGDQSWVFFGRNDAKAETPVLWPPHAKSWLIGKDSDAGRDWGQEEKGTTEDEMAGWHHQLDGRESEWTPGVGDGQGGLACCDSWGRRVGHDWATELNWTELNPWISSYLENY